MADGKGCKCAAHSKSECGCDADWTPQEVYDLRAENERLKEAIRRIAEQDATLSVQGGSVTVTMDETLTDEEKAVLADYLPTLDETARNLVLMYEPYSEVAIFYSKKAATLRGLLERTKT